MNTEINTLRDIIAGVDLTTLGAIAQSQILSFEKQIYGAIAYEIATNPNLTPDAVAAFTTAISTAQSTAKTQQAQLAQQATP